MATLLWPGKYLSATATWTLKPNYLVLAYTGVPDPSFSSTPFGFGGNFESELQAIALQSNGQIVVGGITNGHGTPVTGGLARLDSNGDLDTTFADGGGLMSRQIVSGLLIQRDGKIVAIGGIDNNLVLERYLAN
jgi:hypothetical protein